MHRQCMRSHAPSIYNNIIYYHLNIIFIYHHFNIIYSYFRELRVERGVGLGIRVLRSLKCRISDLGF